MSNKKISELAELTTPTSTDVLPVVNAGSTKKAQLGNLPISTATQTALDAKEATANKSTDVVTDQASNTKYPSVKAVYDWVVGLLTGKQDTLVSGTNIKTINSTSLLGSGDISISANPGGSDTQVQYNSAGSFAGSANLTFDGTTLDANKLNVQERFTIEADSTATTQSVAVIDSTSTNAGIVLKPNGTGAIMAQVPDGTATGGNARGANAVDLQMQRGGSYDVASGNYGVISGGQNNAATNTHTTVAGGFLNSSTGVASVNSGGYANISSNIYSTVGGGRENLASGARSTISGGQNNIASSTHAIISGGQSNTASTGSHATVVGGYGNTSSGSNSISGGNQNVSSGAYSVSFGYSNSATGQSTVTIGQGNAATNSFATAIGVNNVARAPQSITLGANSETQSNASSSATIGSRTNAYLYGQFAHAADRFSALGDAQQSILVARKSDTLASAATTILSLDGTGTTNLIIPYGNNRLWAAKITATAFVSAAVGTTLVLGDSYMAEYTVLFKRVAGTSSVVGTNAGNIISDPNMISSTFTFSAGASQELAITFKAPTTSNGDTFRCVAKVELVEVAY